jgi:ribosome-binding factor A
MAWHGYVLLEINPTFADGLTEQKRRDIVTRIKELISDKRLPAFALGVRWTKDKRACILQGNFDVTSKSEFVKKLAAALGVTQTQVNNNLTMTVFGAGKTARESAQNARSFVAGTLERWKEAL